MTAFSARERAAFSPPAWSPCADYGLTRATALTKLFNLTSNVASVLLFALGGQMWWLLGPVHGGRGDDRRLYRLHTAMRFGASVIRPLLVLISLGLTARLLWGYFAG